MTLRELSQLYYLNREIEADKKRLEEIKGKLLTSGGQKITGMPRGTGYKNRVEQYIADIVDLEAVISAKLTQCIHERKRLERYIAGIPDSLTRQIFTLRFVNGMNWVQISYSVGGGNTEEGVRKRVYRYLERANKSRK